jgi:hypothetical protein
MMSAKRDGMLEGGDKNFTVRAGSQMLPYLTANVGGEFIVDIGRQFPEKLYAMALAMRIAVRRGPGPFLRHRCPFLGHEGKPSTYGYRGR